MKRLAFLISLSITFVPYDVMALSARTVSIEDAQGISGKIITLEVAPGYGLNINLIPTGEIVKKAWIDDPSRITLSFDGHLCQGATQQCNNEGATVIHLRQIKPIQFPDLPRSAGGGTLLTLITEGSQGRKIYQFKVMPISGIPKYTVLNVSSENPYNTPLLPRRNAPLMVNNSQRRGYQNNFQQPQNIARVERQRNNQLAQSPPVKTPVKPVIGFPTPSATSQSATLPPVPTPEISPSPSTTPIPLAPTVRSSQTLPLSNSKPRQTLVSPNPKITETKTLPAATVSTHETPSVPTISKPQSSIISNNKPKLPSVATSKTPPSSNKLTPNTTVSTPKKPLQSNNTNKLPSSSIAQANALVRGLVIARQKGHINNKTKVWKQVQSVVLLLRRGVTKPEAVKKVGVSLQLVDQLIVWGNSPTLTFTSLN